MTETFPLSTWRLLISDPLSGAQNMAIDSAILAAVGREESPPTLRLYRWDPACISLGYSQEYSDVDETLLKIHGWDIVRRPTGGRAILHTDELTYSIIGPRIDHRLKGGLMDSYQNISRALFDALARLGLPVEVHSGKNPLANHQAVCFENPSDFEITANGKKIIGSAQARKKNSLLQHGSLPLTGDLGRITSILFYKTPSDRQNARDVLLNKAATVKDVLGKNINWGLAAKTFVDSFSRVLNLNFVEGELTIDEIEAATELVSNQYGDPGWTRGKSPQKV